MPDFPIAPFQKPRPSQVEIIRRMEEAAERKALEQDYQERSIQQNLYDAFGGIRTARENLPNRYTYNGEIHDHLTSQYYLRARYYSPKAARFTQEDVYRVLFINHVKAS